MERLDLHRGDYVGNNYRVEKALGEGSFGQVFRVTGPNGETNALKLLKMWCISPDERERVSQRFEMEYATGRIDSPYLVHSVGKGEHRGNPFIVMEYCPGGDLMHASHKKGVKLDRALTEVLYGLDALHRHGKVHRDLKPENVLLRHDGTAVLTDFGISGDQNHRLTRRGIFGTPKEIMGTFIYMPPEQVRPPSGNATVRPTTDIFSFGVMLYQLVTGELPFGPLQTEDDMERYCENGRTGRWNRSLLRHHPQADKWMAVVDGCLQPNYSRRLQSVDEVLRLMPKVQGLQPQPLFGLLPNPNRQYGGTGVWRLRVMQGEEAGRVYSLKPPANERGVLRMGRSSSTLRNDIAIVETISAYISRAHCTLEYDVQEQRWYLWDGQWIDEAGGWKPSLNGTFVGSRQVTMNEPSPLAPGDIVTLGDVTLRVEIE